MTGPMRVTAVSALVITSTTGVGRDELLVPLTELCGAGLKVDHATPAGKPVATMRHDGPWDITVKPTVALEAVHAADYDVLVAPGGTINADTLRTDDHALSLATEFASAGTTIAARHTPERPRLDATKPDTARSMTTRSVQ